MRTSTTETAHDTRVKPPDSRSSTNHGVAGAKGRNGVAGGRNDGIALHHLHRRAQTQNIMKLVQVVPDISLFELAICIEFMCESV